MKVSFLGLLGVLFIGLKLCGVINWSWWLVLMPLYLGFVLLVGSLLVLSFLLFAAQNRRRNGRFR